MSIRKRVSAGRLCVPATVLLALTVLCLSWGQYSARPAAAQVPAPGLNFSLSVSDVSGCDSTANGRAECVLQPGDSFVVNVNLNSLPTAASGYHGIDLYVTYTGVISLDDPSMDPWPDCGFPAQFIESGISVRWGCALGIGSKASTYLGMVSTLGFTCTEEEMFGNTINLVHGRTDTSLEATIGSDTIQSAEGAGTMDTLTIHCGQPPRPTNTPGRPGGETPARPQATATALPPTGNGAGLNDGHGTNAPLWILIGALVVAAAGTIGRFGWRYARSR